MIRRTEFRRDAGHPWDGRPGWDVLIAHFEDEDQRDRCIHAAAAKFWKPWLVGRVELTGQLAAVLYRPSGATTPWTDDPPAREA